MSHKKIWMLIFQTPDKNEANKDSGGLAPAGFAWPLRVYYHTMDKIKF